VRVLRGYFGSRSFSNFAVNKSLEGNRLSPWEFSPMRINFECSRFLFLLPLSRSVIFHVIDCPLCGMWIWGVHCKVNSEKM